MVASTSSQPSSLLPLAIQGPAQHAALLKSPPLRPRAAKTLSAADVHARVMESFLNVLLIDVQAGINGPRVVGALRRRFLRSMLPMAADSAAWQWLPATGNATAAATPEQCRAAAPHFADLLDEVDGPVAQTAALTSPPESPSSTALATSLANFFNAANRRMLSSKINADERVLSADVVIFYDDSGCDNGPAHLLAELLAFDGLFETGYLQGGIYSFAASYPGLCEIDGLPIPKRIEELRTVQSDLVEAVWYSHRTEESDFPHVIVPPFLCLGGQNAALPNRLRLHSITHVIRIGFFDSAFDVSDGSVSYHSYRLEDAEHEHIETIFDECIKLIDQVRDNNGRVLVHCHAGVSRSATIVLVYLMQRMGMTLAEAFDLTFKKRPIIRPNEGFGRKLQQLEQQIFGLSTSTMPLCWMSFDYGYYREYLEYLIRVEEMQADESMCSSAAATASVEMVLPMSCDETADTSLLSADVPVANALAPSAEGGEAAEAATPCDNQQLPLTRALSPDVVPAYAVADKVHSRSSSFSSASSAIVSAAAAAVVEAFFADVGPIRKCFVVADNAQPEQADGKKLNRGIAYVHFALPEDAQRAVTELSKKPFQQGRKLKIEVALKRPSQADRLNKRKRPASEAPAADVATEAPAPAAPTATPQPEQPAPKRARHGNNRFPASSPASINRLIVRNLSFKCRQQDLTAAFSKFGKVADVVIPRKWEPNGPFRGFAIVHFTKRAHAEKAMQAINGTELAGRPVAVDWCVPKADYAPDDVVASTIKPATQEKSKQKPVAQPSSDEGSDEEDDEEGSDEEEDEEDSDEGEDEDQGSEGDDDDDSGDEEEDEEEGKEKDEKPSHKSAKQDKPKSTLPSASEGTTLFVRNLSYDTTDQDLQEHFGQFGPVKYARVTKDRDTGRSRGTGFVCFGDKETTNRVLEQSREVSESAQAELTDTIRSISRNATHTSLITPELPETVSSDFSLHGRLLSLTLAVPRDEAQSLSAKDKARAEKQDKRNLFLVREGVITAELPAAEALSKTELEKRVASYDERKQSLAKNLNLFISPTRLSVRNLPATIDDKQLKRIALDAVAKFDQEAAAGERDALTADEEARFADDAPAPARKSPHTLMVRQAIVIRSKDRIEASTNLGRSKGFGFVEFVSHPMALKCLRYLNNNPTVFGPARRPFVEFSLEDKAVVRKREERAKRANTPQDSHHAPANGQDRGTGNDLHRPGTGRGGFGGARGARGTRGGMRGSGAPHRGSFSSRGSDRGRGGGRGGRGSGRGSDRGSSRGSSRGSFRGRGRGGRS
ncbi:RNA recognition motif-containing protein [Sorochytrium milnesiophthora]